MSGEQPVSSTSGSVQSRVIFIVALICAGEAVYALPFHVTRFFRPTVLEVFDITATELGAAQGLYGIIAMVAYFPGGPLADRFPARKLLAFSLWSTAVGGLCMATFPGYAGSLLVWGFFGVTTILLFWAALIRATRDWGGADTQGRAYGLLDGGRGLLQAAMATVGVILLSLTLPEGTDPTLQDKEQALRLVIYFYTGVTTAVGFLVWFGMEDIHPAGVNGDKPKSDDTVLQHIKEVLRIKAVWMQALILFCAYVAFKGFDNYSLFAAQAYNMRDDDAAMMATLGSYVRPIAALGAGLLADRFNASRMLFLGFIIVLASDLVFAFTEPVPGGSWILLGNILIACVAIFGFRALYFALLEEAKVPPAMTGTAVGLVSIVGYTPDIFVALVAGILIDANPGAVGHQHFFMFLAAFAALGVVVSYMLMRMLHAGESRA